MFKKERIPFPSSKNLETMKGKVSEEKEIVLENGEKKFVRFVEQGGGLIGVLDKEKWAGILNHSLLVRRMTTYLARELKAAGEDIDLKAVSDESLLHDIGRRWEDEGVRYKKEPGAAGSHGRKGAEILKQAGFPKKVSEAVEAHYFPQKMEDLDTWEKKLIFYADMRVAQSIMPLNDRLNDLEERWVPNKITQETMDRTKKIAHDVEQEIFSKLVIKPDDILDIPMPRVERYLRAVVERNLEDRAIKFFRGLESRKAEKNKE